MATTMVSILHNNKSKRDYHFHVITSSITDKSKAVIQKLQKKFKFDISYIHIQENDERLRPVQGIRQPAHVGLQSIFIRLMLPDILPTLDKVLSMDVDLYVREDLANLYDTDLGNYCLAAVEDVAETVFSNFLWNDPHHHFYNTGVMLQNLKQMRNIGYSSILVNTLRANSRKYRIGEQDSFNDIYKDKICHLNYTWNFYHSFHFELKRFTPDYPNEFQEAARNPAIVHFVGPEKPWFPCMRHPFKSDYLFYYRKNPFYRFRIFSKHNYKLRYSSHKQFKFMGLDVLSVKETKDNKSVKVLYCSVYKRTKGDIRKKCILGIPYSSTEEKNGVKKCKYLFGLYKTVVRKDSHTKYIMGIPFVTKKISNQFALLNKQLQNINDRLTNIKCFIEAQSIHQKTFASYRNAFEGRVVVIVCPGPTANYYTPIQNAIHVGINGAIYLNIDLDYAFIQDNTINQPGNEKLTNDFLNYDRNNCKKFIGIPPDKLREVNYVEWNMQPVSVSAFKNHISPYIIKLYDYASDGLSAMPYDISYEPIANLSGTVFSAMQFILYTNPKMIYLVGCDCSTGHAYDSNCPIFVPLDKLHPTRWKIIKQYIDVYFPHIVVKSINPFNLKGLFRDVYTKSYIMSQPEMVSTNVDILDAASPK